MTRFDAGMLYGTVLVFVDAVQELSAVLTSCPFSSRKMLTFAPEVVCFDAFLEI